MVVPKDAPGLWKYIREHGRNLDGADLSGALLDNFDFRDASLVGADLSEAHLGCADFGTADVSRANFSGAQLGRASFVSTSARNADFSKALAIAVDFAMGTFASAQFTGAQLERANFTESDLSEADFTEADLTNAVFSHAVLANTNLAASFVGTIFVGCDLHQGRLLSHALCEGVFVDTTTLERLTNAFHGGESVLEALGLLLHGGVRLPSVLEAVAKRATIPERHDDDAFDLLSEFRVELGVGPIEVDAFLRVLNAAVDERPLQRFLEDNPSILVQPLAANHRGWVLPQKKLGDQFVADFLACGLTSLGHEWLAIELENPHAPLFTKAGNPSAELTHAIRQIHDWRDFLSNNLEMARRARQMKGLGLRDISPEPLGLILIGRQAGIDRDTDQLRRRLCKETRIEIRTYDYLVDACRNVPGRKVPLVRGNELWEKDDDR